MRTIDADKLIESVKYACESNGDELSLKWLDWFKYVISIQPTIETNKSEIGSSRFVKGE